MKIINNTNLSYKEIGEIIDKIISTSKEYITDDGFVEEVLRDVKKILDNKGE